jgi:hypothetical protein
VKVLLFLPAVLSTSAFAATIGACAPATLASLVGNPCALGDKVFSNFSYTGNGDPSDINVDFQMADNGAEFRLSLELITGAGFLTNFTFTDPIAAVPGDPANPLPAVYQIVGVKNQSDFSFARNSSGLLDVANSPGPTYHLMPGNDTGSPAFIAPTTILTTTSTLTGTGGVGDANPGLSNFELGYIQADTAVSEPSSFGLIGLTLLGLGLLRRRAA